MKITNFDPVMLNSANMLTNGRNPYTDVYKLQNNRIFKMIKSPKSNDSVFLRSYREFYIRFCQKLEQAKKLGTIDCLTTPEEISIGDNGRVQGYFYKFNDSKTLEELNIDEQDFDFISKCFLDISLALEKLHEHNVVIPDLFNPANILYDPSTEKVSFIDYDGMQVGNVPTNCISSSIEHKKNPILRNRKYNRFGLYTKNIDQFELILSYLHSLSGVNLASLSEFQSLYSSESDPIRFLYEKECALEVLKSLGIDDIDIQERLVDPFTSKDVEVDAHTLVKKFSDRYKYGVTREDGIRTFVRR